MGFAFALLPLARRWGGDRKRVAAFLTRHLQLFNTHPYLAGPIIGSVVRMEETQAGTEDSGREISSFKNAVMGPYAALGDSFFWGALKPLAAIFGVLFALLNLLLAPWAFLVLFNPAHLWVRGKGFAEGYRLGRDGIDFVRHLNLQLLTARLRWVSLAGLGAIAALLSQSIPVSFLSLPVLLVTKGIFLSFLLLCYWGLKNGISQVKMLYGMFILSSVIAL